MGLMSKIGAAGRAITQKISNLAKPLTSKLSPILAGKPLTSSTKISTRGSTPTFSDLVRSSPMSIKNAPAAVSLAMGIPGSEITRQKAMPTAFDKPAKSGISANSPKVPTRNQASTPTQTKTTPTIEPSAGMPIMPALGAAAALTGAGLAGMSVSSGESGGNNMGWYDALDENLAGILPGGEKIDYGQAALMAGVALAGGGIAKVLSSGSLYGTVKGWLGGSKRKVYRRRIGLKRSDVKRMKAVSRDLHRIDKVVNMLHIADVKFRPSKR